MRLVGGTRLSRSTDLAGMPISRNENPEMNRRVLYAGAFAAAFCAVVALMRGWDDTLQDVPQSEAEDPAFRQKIGGVDLDSTALESDARREPALDGAGSKGGGDGNLDEATSPIAASYTREEVKKKIQWIGDLDKSYTESFRKKALRWPQGVPVSEGIPDFGHEKMNPAGKAISAASLQHLKDIISIYDDQLIEGARVAAELGQEAMRHYYDSDSAIWYRTKEGRPEEIEYVGPHSAFSRDATLDSDEWSVRIRFQSGLYPAFNDQLVENDRLNSERLQAVLAYLEQL